MSLPASGAAEAPVDPVFCSTPATSQVEPDLSAGSTGASATPDTPGGDGLTPDGKGPPSTIVVRSRYAIGWPEKDPGTVAVEGGSDVALLPLDVTLSSDFPDDHHFTQYTTTRLVRLNTEAIGRIAISMVALVLDVDDREVHKLSGEARDAWRASEQPKIDKLLDEQPGVFVYETSGGYRLVGTLEQPLPLTDDKQRAAWSTYYKACVDEVAQRYDIHADKLSDFTRSFRAPFVVRNGVKQEPKIYCGAAPLAAPWKLNTKYAGSLREGNISDVDPTLTVVTEVPKYSEAERLAAVEDELTRLLNGRYGEMFRALLDGAPLVENGIRHTAMVRVAGVLTSAAPSATEDDFIELLRPSLAATESLGPVKEPAEYHMRGILSTSIATAAARRQIEAVRKARERIEWARWREMFVRNRPTYTAEQLLKEAANFEGIDEDKMRKRLVLQFDGAYFLLTDPGEYAPAISSKQLDISFRDWTAKKFGISTKYLAQNGTIKDRKLDEMLRDYTTTTRGIRSSLIEERTHLDLATNTIIEAPLRRRQLMPLYDANVDTWLRLLGGPTQERLLDWIATINRLDRPTAALYLSGPKSSGKGMLAAALARLWREGGPVLAKDAFGNWNGALLECPLVFCDEALPMVDGKQVTSAVLRELIAATTHTIRRKFLPNSTCDGALRFYFADNHATLLDFDEMLASEDADAIASRFLWITVDRRAAQFLETLGGWRGTEDWVTGDRIVRHFLWLAENRQVTQGNRFLVEGDIGALKSRILTRSRLSSLVCEWAVNAVLRGDKQASALVSNGDLLVGDGRVLVGAATIAEHWVKFVKSDRPRSADNISRVLSSWERETVTMANRKYRVIDASLLLGWARTAMPEDADALEAKLSRTIVLPNKLVKESLSLLPGGADENQQKTS